MTTMPDSEFAKAHEVFSCDHVDQREQLMDALARTSRIPKLSRWRMIPLSIRLTAAGLMIAATVALLSLSPSDRAYGIEGLRERLLTIRSLHVKGWVYHDTNTASGNVPLAFPTELFCERPFRQYRTGFSFSDNGRKLEVTSHVFVGDGEQAVLIDKDNKTATVTPANKLHSELMVEGFLQQRFLDELGKGDLSDFEKVGAQRINDVDCDIYELKSSGRPGGRHVDGPDDPIRFRTRLWLNPENGMPVKVACYEIEQTGEEQVFWEWTEIGINVDPPKGMFSFEVPDGYEKVEAEPIRAFDGMATLTGGGGMSSNGKSASVSSGVALNIDDRAVLYCWSVRVTDKDGPRWFEGQPEFSLDARHKRPAEDITLRTDAVGDERARWSLILPADGRPLGSASLIMIYRLDRSTSSMDVTPLKFAPQRLVQIVEEVQRSTLSANSDTTEIWTLDELRAKLAEVQ